jgi:uncharacterized delta-60 repeat protein
MRTAPFKRRSAALALAALLGALLLLPGPARAASQGEPARIWSVSEVQQGAGAVPVANGAQLGGRLFEKVKIAPVAFNLPLPDPFWSGLPRDDAFGSLFSAADGSQYSVLAQAPSLNPHRARAPKGTITHLDELQAYEKRAGDASLRITISGLLMQLVDDNGPLGASECPAHTACEPVRAVVRFHARAYAESAGGDFFDAGGVAYFQGHQHAWRPGAATAADSPRPLWGEKQFDVDGDADDSKTGASAEMSLRKPVSLKVPLASVRPGELFAVHVSLQAEAVDDRGRESAAQAAIQDPQHREPALLTASGLKQRGKPRFKEPPVRSLAPAQCATRRRGSGALSLSSPAFTASESSSDPMVLVTRSGGSRGAASVTLTAHSATARSGRDFRATKTTVRFADGDSSPRLVEVPLREDADAEAPERFSVELSHVRCGALGARHRATVTILDDDQPPPPDPPPPGAPIGGTPPPGSSAPAPATGLDATFGSGGRVSTPVGGFGHGEAVVIQPSGAIVTAGWHSTPTGNDFALTRHDAAGNLDGGFGVGGIAATDLGGDDDEAYDAALLPDGGIVAVGRTDAASFTNTDFGVVRYLPDGAPNPGFGSGGVVTTDVLGGGDQANAVAVQPDGKIVVAGFATRSGIDGDVALVRYDADGTPDDTFGTHGVVTTDLGTRSDDARAVVVQPDGRIVVAGTADEDIALARYTSAGQLDGSFGTGGTTVTDLGSDDVANAVALTPDGEIEVAGYTLGAHVDRDFLLARYKADGTLDTAFADHGTVRTDLGAGDDFAENLIVDAQGRTVLVGRATSATILDMALVRYDAAGALDPTFDGDGIVTADFHGRGEFGQDLALDAAGRIVAAGYTANGPDTEFALLRTSP